MRALWLCAFMALGVGCGGLDGDQDCPDCSDGSGGGGSGSGGGSSSDGCKVMSEVAASGPLVGYEVSGSGEWILTREDDAHTTLWENTGAGWHGRSLGVSCLHGVMGLDAQSGLHVACLVRANAPQAYDLRVFTLSPQQVNSTLAVEAIAMNRGSWNAVPLSITFDSSGRPLVLWHGALDGLTPDWFGYVGVSRLASAGWDVVADYNTERVNGTSRLVGFGSELAIAYHDTVNNTLVLARAGSELTTLAELAAPEGLESTGFASAFDLAVSADGTLHLAVADTTPDIGGTVSYFRKQGSGPFIETRLDEDAAYGTLSLTLGPNEAPLVSYHSDATTAVRLARKTGTTWTTDDLDTDGVGSRSVVRLDGEGDVHVAYQDDVTGQVNVLHQACTP